jgi:DNA-binding response OmpR family regulator
VLFVEDEESISGPFSSTLRREGFEVTVADSLAAARACREFDLVLLDLMLPDGDGRDFARSLRASASVVQIIFLNARGTELVLVVGLELGADDYVVKPFSGAEVIARMRAVLRRVKPSPAAPSDLSIGPLRVEASSRRVWLSGEELALSRKEFDLLVELMTHAGEVVTREGVGERVPGAGVPADGRRPRSQARVAMP